jgi:hypothetical protein
MLTGGRKGLRSRKLPCQPGIEEISMRTFSSRIIGAIVVGLGLLGSISAASAGTAQWVADSDASAFMQYSAWAYENQINYLGCTGVGAAHKFVAGTGHAAFRCKVESGATKGVVVAKASGPEWLRVTKVLSGGFKPDPGFGSIPAGKQVMDDDRAESALESSAWGSKANVDEAFCSGIGPYHGTLDTTGYLFGAFDCSTLNPDARQGPQVLVVVTGTSSVRIAKTFTR